MELTAPSIVLAVAPFGEGDALVSVFSEEHGVYRGLARGGLSRQHASLWQPGNLVQARGAARLADQLGSFTGELIHAGAALAMDDPWALAILSALCAVAEGALPEREPHPFVFGGALRLVAQNSRGATLLADLVRWEAALLQELGYGLDLGACAVTGAREGLAYVSPRTGRAVCADAAGLWKERLLALPDFLVSGGDGNAAGWAAGLRLTGHFLARDAFGLRHLPVPQARLRLEERVWRVCEAEEGRLVPHGRLVPPSS